jgi:hypothetical protein
MRTNEDFIGDLRKEIVAGMERRFKYVIYKLSFIIGLFSIGYLTISTIQFFPLLYLIPFVAFVYDLYILAEDFGVKRSGRFIKGSFAAPPEERRYEKMVRINREPFRKYASIASSLIVIFFSVIILWYSQKNNIFYYIWLITVLIFVLLTFIYDKRLVRKNKSIDEYLKTEEKEFDHLP